MLSQEEINALFGTSETKENEKSESLDFGLGLDGDGNSGETESGGDMSEYELTDVQKDILGEIGNISMGTSASTLYTLLGERHKVDITTPRVEVLRWSDVAKSYDRPCVGIRVNYTEGIDGTNALILKERDVKIISDLMMGGDGLADPDGPINELDLSAIAESMNQMIGSSSTSLASLINTKIDIDTPTAFLLDFNDDNFFESVRFTGDLVSCISFRMVIGDLIDSEIMQIWPVDFAKRMVDIFMVELMEKAEGTSSSKPQAQSKQAPPQKETSAPPPQQQQPQQQYQQQPQQNYQPEQQYGYPPMQQQPRYIQPNINAQPVRFESFDAPQTVYYQKENIDIIRDVPLEVTVELGRTNKKIKEILEFSPGSIVLLDKLAGETLDILINGKFVARGEVVVIEENFAVKITDIISAENRI